MFHLSLGTVEYIQLPDCSVETIAIVIASPAPYGAGRGNLDFLSFEIASLRSQ